MRQGPPVCGVQAAPVREERHRPQLAWNVAAPLVVGKEHHVVQAAGAVPPWVLRRRPPLGSHRHVRHVGGALSGERVALVRGACKGWVSHRWSTAATTASAARLQGRSSAHSAGCLRVHAPPLTPSALPRGVTTLGREVREARPPVDRPRVAAQVRRDVEQVGFLCIEGAVPRLQQHLVERCLNAIRPEVIGRVVGAGVDGPASKRVTRAGRASISPCTPNGAPVQTLAVRLAVLQLALREHGLCAGGVRDDGLGSKGAVEAKGRVRLW